MPVTFVDGSSADLVFTRELGLHDMQAMVYTAGGLHDVDRTMDFRYGSGSSLMSSGPLETYVRPDGTVVEVWESPPMLLCPSLVYRFGDWYVFVRVCQPELSMSEKQEWAENLQGRVTEGGFLVLDAGLPLRLAGAGEHEGPQLVFVTSGRHSPFVQFRPIPCDPATLPEEGDIRIMPDGTKVSFSRIGGDEGDEDNWGAMWCEDDHLRVQIDYATREFAELAADVLRVRNIAIADP